MDNSEKEVRAFYAMHTKNELQIEIWKDENSLRKVVPRAKDRMQQKMVECKIATLRDMALNYR